MILITRCISPGVRRLRKVFTASRKACSPWGQWRRSEGYHGTRHAPLAGREAVVLTSAGQR